MKISPVMSAPNTAPTPEAPAVQHNLRSLKMKTDATPEHYQPPEEILEEKPTTDQELPISTQSEANATVEDTQPLSPQFAALAKQRRSLQVKERELKEREKALETSRQGSQGVDLARLKSEPLNVLLEAGVTYDDLTNAILANQGSAETNALKQEIKALKESIDQKFKDNEDQGRKQVLSEMTKHANILASQGDAFELVRETGSIPDVIRLIENVYDESGEVLDVSEALKLVEDELFTRSQSLLKAKKMQGVIQPKPPEVQAQQRPGMRTLTNKDTASVPMSAKQRAIAAFYGTLKK